MSKNPFSKENLDVLPNFFFQKNDQK